MTVDQAAERLPLGRMPRALTRQQQQKQDSRLRILQAAREVLSQTPYASMRVEDVIARAGVSRATFYKHFDSKFAIGRALHVEFAPRLYAHYDILLDYADPTEAELIAWVQRLVALYRDEKDLIVTFAHMLAIEPAFHPIMIDIIRQTEERWAERLPAFRVPGSNAPDAMRARIESRMLLRQLNDFCYEVAIFDWKIDIEEGCRIVGGYFRAFLQRYRPVQE